MQVWQAPAEVPGDVADTAVTIGVFDGVHRGHQAVIGRMVAEAHDRGLRPVVVTFDPNPMETLRPSSAPLRVCPLGRRLELIAGLGVDGTLVLHFDAARADQSADDFIDEVLVTALHARLAVVGQGFRFGHRAAGDVDLLTRRGVDAGLSVEVVPPVGDGARWSSTLVRTHVAAGEVAAAATILGRPHEVSGVVVHGDHRGRGLGYPTANLDVPARALVPADGVYAGRLRRVGGPDWPAAISVGTNPTFDGHVRRVEGHVLGRDDLDLYGEQVVLEFVDRLRPTLRFATPAELVEQMARDVAAARAVLEG